MYAYQISISRVSLPQFLPMHFVLSSSLMQSLGEAQYVQM